MSEATKMKALIIDDEAHARENLKMLVEEFCQQVEVVGTASGADEGHRMVEEHRPDLVFLDIMMPGKDGFGFLNLFEERDFEVIFTTAHNEHALRAIKSRALHYLEKPINIEELQEAVQRAEEQWQLKSGNSTADTESIRSLLESMSSGLPGKAAIATSDGLSFVNESDIVHLEASDQYTIVHLVDGSRMMSSKNIKNFEEKLNEKVFFRLHRSHIVNIAHHLKAFSRIDGGTVVLSNDEVIPISRRKLSLFLQRVNAG